jgi:hypothetical protein
MEIRSGKVMGDQKKDLTRMLEDADYLKAGWDQMEDW